MKVAFYAPLKPPDHPVPSGDRMLARALLAALRAGGHVPSIASRFRSFDRGGDALHQARLRALGLRIAERFVARYRTDAARPQAWFTYHVYHKAPDWLGPTVARSLGIPYVIAEASIAGKQRDGAWALGYEQTLRCVEDAAAVVSVNPDDLGGVQGVRGIARGDPILRPFVDIAAFAGEASAAARPPPTDGARLRLVTVAMMREGAKLASYRLLAAALARITELPWDLVVVGDGPARPAVESALAVLSPGRVRFAGALGAAGVAGELRASDLFVWPAIDEAFGMAFIEAQACGLPVVAGDAGGVASVVLRGHSAELVAVGDAAAFAAAVRDLLGDAARRRAMGATAARYVREQHDLPGAATTLDRLLRRVVAQRDRPAAASAGR